jgi:hypothetical protein
LRGTAIGESVAKSSSSRFSLGSEETAVAMFADAFFVITRGGGIFFKKKYRTKCALLSTSMFSKLFGGLTNAIAETVAPLMRTNLEQFVVVWEKIETEVRDLFYDRLESSIEFRSVDCTNLSVHSCEQYGNMMQSKDDALGVCNFGHQCA